MARTPNDMRTQARMQQARMQSKLAQSRAEKEEAAQQNKKAAAVKVVVKKMQEVEAKAQAKSASAKALEAELHSRLLYMIKHMKEADKHWLSAMKMFAKAQWQIAKSGVDPKTTTFYKNLSYIDDVYEGMMMFTKKAIETNKL